MSGEFRTGLCDCCGSLSDCLIGYFLPCVEAGLAANSANTGIFCTALQCFCYPLFVPCLRNQVRTDRGIDGNICGDVIYGWCCPCCSVIQIKREYD